MAPNWHLPSALPYRWVLIKVHRTDKLHSTTVIQPQSVFILVFLVLSTYKELTTITFVFLAIKVCLINSCLHLSVTNWHYNVDWDPLKSFWGIPLYLINWRLITPSVHVSPWLRHHRIDHFSMETSTGSDHMPPMHYITHLTIHSLLLNIFIALRILSSLAIAQSLSVLVTSGRASPLSVVVHWNLSRVFINYPLQH